MSSNRVVWTEGLFIQQQHFQQQERFLDQALAQQAALSNEWFWGFSRLELDRSACAIGKILIQHCAGVLRDGMVFNCPQNDNLPAPLDVPADSRDELVYLALPMLAEGRPSYAYQADGEGMLARFVTNDCDVPDAFSQGESVKLLVGALNLRLVMQRDLTGAWVGLAIARVKERKADGSVILDEAFIPAALNCTFDQVIFSALQELAGLVRQRAVAISQRIAGPSKSSVSDIAEFLMLQTLNRHIPALEQLLHRPAASFAGFFLLAQQLAGELSTFTSPNKLPEKLPFYDHDQPWICLPALMKELRQMLSMVFEQSAIAIELQERSFGVRVAVVPDIALFDDAQFILAAKANVPSDALRVHLPKQIKIGPVEKIRNLISIQLPGITIAGLPVVPRQIPFHAGFNYFELDKGSEFWSELNQSGGIALHIAGDFPGIELELWAIRT